MPAPAITGCASAANFAMAWLTLDAKGEDLAARFGVTRASATRIANKLGLPPRRRGPKPQHRKRV
jgi:hypothetical protein